MRFYDHANCAYFEVEPTKSGIWVLGKNLIPERITFILNSRSVLLYFMDCLCIIYIKQLYLSGVRLKF